MRFTSWDQILTKYQLLGQIQTESSTRILNDLQNKTQAWFVSESENTKCRETLWMSLPKNPFVFSQLYIGISACGEKNQEKLL